MVARSGTMPGAGGQGSAAQVPWGWLGYAQVIVSQGSITTETDLTGLTVTVTVGAGRRILIRGDIDVTGGAGDSARCSIKEGATVLQYANGVASGTANILGQLQPVVVLTPSAGAHTYKLSLQRVNGVTGAFVSVASATQPAFIHVEDIGPAA